MAILLRDTNVVYRPGSKIPIRQSREKVLSASRNSLLLLKPKSVTTYLQHITYAYASSLKEPFAQTKRKFKNLNLSKTYVYLRIIYRSNAFYINPFSLWLIQQSGVNTLYQIGSITLRLDLVVSISTILKPYVWFSWSVLTPSFLTSPQQRSCSIKLRGQGKGSWFCKFKRS